MLGLNSFTKTFLNRPAFHSSAEAVYLSDVKITVLGRVKMAEFKIVISDQKTGKSYQREVKDKPAEAFLGKKIGDTISGDSIELAGYEFLITGGSDYCGFPMRKDVEGILRKKILTTQGIGVKTDRKGMRVRKRVAGNTIHSKTTQINLKILKHGREKTAAYRYSSPKNESPMRKLPRPNHI